jgi:hypothetical protein
MSNRIAALAVLVVVVLTGCGSRSKAMPVSYMEGDFESVKAATWEMGEIKKCEMAGRTSSPPDARGDLLLCDVDTWVAWSQGKFNPAMKSAVYDDAKMFSVRIRGAGHDEPWVSGNGHDTFWQCKKTADGIDCQ